MFNKKVNRTRAIQKPRARIMPYDYDYNRTRQLRETQAEVTRLNLDYNALKTEALKKLQERDDKIEGLEKDLRFSENQRTKKNKEIAVLKSKLEENQKEFSSLVSQFESEQRKVESKNKDIEELELRNFKLSEFEIKEIFEKFKVLEEYKKEFKKFVVKYGLNNNFERYEKKTLDYCLDIFRDSGDLKKSLSIKESEPDSKQEILKLSFDDNDPEFKDYIKSEICFCGKPKKRSGIGCKNHKKEADRIRKNEDISMREAWKRVWRIYGGSLE